MKEKRIIFKKKYVKMNSYIQWINMKKKKIVYKKREINMFKLNLAGQYLS